jgi:hypothetical protein
MDPLTFSEDVERRKRMLPMALQSAGGTLSNSVQPGQALPMTMRQRLGKVYDELDKIEGQDVDTSALQAFARQQGQAGEQSMLNALAAQYAGESFQPVQAQFLKRAAAATEPMKIGGGMLTPAGEFIKDPFAARDARRASVERQAMALERQVEAQTRDERDRQDRLRQQDIANDFRQQGLSLQQRIAEMRAADKAGGQVGSFSPAGFTPQGQQVVTNTKSGVSYLLSVQPDGTPNYTPYQGPMIPKATFDKEVTAAGDLSAVARRASTLVEMVESNPDAFGLRSAAVAAMPGAVQGYAAKAVGLTPEQLEARSTVLRQAAQEINELYGAALSMGEQARANTFLPNPSDPPEMLISKLKAARDWAQTQVGRYSSGVQGAAKARSGDAPGSAGAGGLTPAEMEELAKLRAKHGRQ